MYVRHAQGNARVTPEVTRDVCLLARMMTANMYLSKMADLMFEVHRLRFVISPRASHNISIASLTHPAILFPIPMTNFSIMWRCNNELRAHADELHRQSYTTIV